MRLLIFGAGAIGCYCGAKLAAAGHDVTLVMREAAAAAVRQAGLTLKEAAGKEGVLTRPRAVASLDEAMRDDAQFGLALLSVRAYDVAQAVAELNAYGRRIAMVVTLQNGVGAEETAAEALGARRVVAAAVTTPVAFRGTVVTVGATGRGIGLAPLVPDWHIGEWASLLQGAGLQVETHDDYRALKWSKLLLNLAGNATAAILNWSPGKVYRHGSVFKLEIGMLREALAVMEKRNLDVVNLPGIKVRRLALAVRNLPTFLYQAILARRIEGGRGGNPPSFKQALAQGRTRSEVTYYNGAVARAGWHEGVSTPINTVLTELMLRLLRGELPRSRFADRPEALLELVAERRRQWRAQGDAADAIG